MRPRQWCCSLLDRYRPTSLAKQAVTLMSLFLLSAPVWGEGQSQSVMVDDILGRMSSANRELDYQGIFTYEYAGVLKSVKVTHVVRDGIAYQHWYYLNGPRQEAVRFSADGACTVPGDNLERSVNPTAVGGSDRLNNHYELQLRGSGRVADRSVWLIHIVPRDMLRYGYVFAVDQQTGLLLQSLLLDSDKRVLERFQYMDVSFAVAPDVAEAVLARIESGEVATPQCLASEQSANTIQGWQAAWLPPGFALASSEKDDRGVETLVFSDGLSVFSIFFDPTGNQQLPEVQAQRGATVAQMIRIEAAGRNYLVSVVGEVPVETAQRVAGFIKYGSD